MISSCRLWPRLLIAALTLAAQGCAKDPGPSDNPGSSGRGGPTEPEPQAKSAGAHCSCDTDCAGDRAVCLLGICMARAPGHCAAPGSEDGCDPGYRCFDTDMLADTGVCFPPFDPITCDGVENRFGLCSPLRGDVCDGQCGPACAAAGVSAGNAGAPCEADDECSLPEGVCYLDLGSVVDPHGWVDGYCLSVGCEADAECGPEAGCYAVAQGGQKVCMNTCGMDLDCRAGYTCKTLEGSPSSFCHEGCDAAATCPGGHACLGDICISDEIACSDRNPYGFCPGGAWCDAGKCNPAKFTCGAAADGLEPNDTVDTAVVAPPGATEGLTLCEGDEDWYRVVVPEKTLVRVGIRFQDAAGDVDLVAYDVTGNLLGSRFGEAYPYSFRDQETNTEYYGFYSEKGGDTYYVRALGHKGAQNVYGLHVGSFPYVDGPSCEDAGFSFDECAGIGPGGGGLLIFPFPDPQDSVVGASYVSESFSNYRFARRELIMLVRHALSETLKAFPDTTRLSLVDICQIDGVTPGYDVGAPRHPKTTHDKGGNIDIAYFQTDGANDAQIICGDGSEHEDGWCSPAAAQTHIVDLPRQAYFMAKLYSSKRTRVIGVDEIIGPLLAKAAADLRDLPDDDPKKITAAEYQGFVSKMSYGSGWPYHHHHIHLSLQWWPKNAQEQSAPPELSPPELSQADPSAAEP